jgi:hypothetical protein
MNFRVRPQADIQDKSIFTVLPYNRLRLPHSFNRAGQIFCAAASVIETQCFYNQRKCR